MAAGVEEEEEEVSCLFFFPRDVVPYPKRSHILISCIYLGGGRGGRSPGGRGGRGGRSPGRGFGGRSPGRGFGGVSRSCSPKTVYAFLAHLLTPLLHVASFITERRRTRKRSLLDLLCAKGLHDYLVDCLYRNQI